MKIYTTAIILLLSATMIFNTACHKITGIGGNNQVATETRQVVSFNEVDNEGSFNVYISHDSVFSATVEAESNLIPYIQTIVNGNTLRIDTRENLKNNQPMNVYVTTPIIRGATLSGSGTIVLDSLETDYLDIVLSGSGKISGFTITNQIDTRISGSGNVSMESYTNSSNFNISGSGNFDLTGESSSGVFTISGSGNINSYNYQQSDCIAKISGSGDMYLNVTDHLDVNISGSGSVYYIGNPTITVKITGSGQVISQ
jgi:hypothetical protein